MFTALAATTFAARPLLGSFLLGLALLRLVLLIKQRRYR